MSEAQPFRNASGGQIDRSRPLQFKFNGRTYGGFAGDTVASALLANGIQFVGRSFKYHRPRGISSAGAEEANALVQIGRGSSGEPNILAPLMPLRAGLIVQSQNASPSL